jgi:hypothetical protein
MSTEFALIDLESQAPAVQRHLRGQAADQKLAWLGARGILTQIESRVRGYPQTFRFESRVGRECVFFLDGDTIVFIGNNTTYTVDE